MTELEVVASVPVPLPAPATSVPVVPLLPRRPVLRRIDRLPAANVWRFLYQDGTFYDTSDQEEAKILAAPLFPKGQPSNRCEE